MTEHLNRYWGNHKPVMLARPAETVQMAATAGKKTAQIRLYGPIDSWGAPFGVAASEVASALDSIGSADVELHVHSPGGDAFEGLAIMNLLRQHKGDVSMIVDGLAASAASIVAMGANTVTMVPGSQMMIHDASALAIGQADDMRQAADMLDSISSNAADQYAAKSGKPSVDMRAAMKATTWYKAQEAVDAGLADDVLAPDDPQTTAAAKATASLRFDLSIYPNAPAMDATEAPADQPVTPPTDHKEAVTMTDIPTAGLVKALGLPDDADEDTILEAVEAKITASASADPPSAEAVAKAYGLTAEQATAALDAAKAGKQTVSQSYLDALEANAKLGAEARAQQLRTERDDAINAALGKGFIAAAQVDSWKADWDRDPVSAKAELAKLDVARFPVGDAPGVAGDDDSQPGVFNDDEAKQLAAMAGVSMEALTHG